MPIFEYKATDSSGTPVNGTLLSNSLVAAAEELGKRGLSVVPVSLKKTTNDPIPQEFSRRKEAPQPAPLPAAPPPTEKRSVIMTDVVGPLIMKVPLSQLLFFFRQLA